jgi:hypothetical protein
MFMQSHRDASVLRSLALSFGEGLAFSVGMKLTRNAIRAGSPPVEAPDFGPIAARLEQIEQRVAKAERPRESQALDQRVISAIVSALETRLQEHSGQVERRVEQESAALRDEVRVMHREFAAHVAQVVGEQVALRAAEMEPVVEARVAAAVAPLHAELTELRARMAETENTMAEFVSAISMMCRQAADRNKEARAVEAEPPAVEPQPEPAAVDLPVPGFAQPRTPPGTWRIPVASSFLFAFAAAGLLMRAF